MRGGSQAHLMRASDGAFYVLKFQNSPQGCRILANEMFATSLGLWLGLPMTQPATIEVCDWLIDNTQELRIVLPNREVRCSSGLQFGSRYPCDLLSESREIHDYLPESFMGSINQSLAFARVLVLDKWLANVDGRQAIFIRKKRSDPFNAVFIDQGYCLNALEWTFQDLTLHGVYYRNSVYKNVMGWDAFEPTLTKAEQADINDIWRCANSIAPEWYDHDIPALEKMVQAVHARRGKIRSLIDAFRQSTRMPFPNWKGNP